MSAEIEIRPIITHGGFRECEQLQQQIWGFSDISVVPHHLLLTAQKNGGVLLGAYEPDGRMIGFVFGFPGYDAEHKRWKHCSLMCGVLSDKRYRGVGYRLKLAQREAVLAQGLDLITWTFDPLQSANAHFNFRKLGVIARRYEENLYGDMRDELNRGLPTDRFAVEWWIRSPRVRARVENPNASRPVMPEDAPVVNRTERRAGLLVNAEIQLDLRAERLLVEIPTDINALRQQDLELTQRWRLETREIFQGYLAQGYLVSEFCIVPGERRGFYLLERARPEDVLERDPSVSESVNGR
jgi:predicted GNAT superfamily acetyltransferase